MAPGGTRERSAWDLLRSRPRRAGWCSIMALLDLDDPRIVLRQSDEWVFGPRATYERAGDVGQVVFACGWILDAAADRLSVYYGAADSVVALATASFSDVMDSARAAPRYQRRRAVDASDRS